MPEPATPENPRRITAMVWVAAIFVVLIVAPVFFIKFVMTPEWIDENVVPEIEAVLGRDVEFEDLSLGFRGLSLKKLKVSEDPAFERKDHPQFASLDRLLLKVKLLPLLRRRIVVQEVVLGDPLIVIHRNAEGVYNFESFASSGDDPETSDASASAAAPEADTEDAEVAENKAAEDDDATVRLVAQKVRLQNAHFIFVDETASASALNQVELRKFNLAAEGISLDAPFEAYAAGEIALAGIAPIDIEAGIQYAPRGPFIGAELEIAALDVDALMAVLAPDEDAPTPEPTDSEPLDLEGYILQGELAIGRVLANGIEIRDLTVEADLVNNALDVKSMKANVGDGSIEAKASVGISEDPPSYKADITVDEVSLSMLATTLAESFFFEPTGTIDLRLQASGAGPPDVDAILAGKTAKGEDFTIDGLKIENGGGVYRPEGAPGLRLQDLNVRCDRLKVSQPAELDVAVTLVPHEGEPAKIEADATLDLSKSRLDVELRLGEIDVDAMTASISGPESVASNTGPAVEAGPIDTGPLTIAAHTKATSVRSAGLVASDVDSKIELGGGKLRISSFEAKASGGLIKMSGSVDLAKKGLGYDGQLSVNGVNAAELVSPFWSQGWGALTGTMNFDTKIRGAGTLADSIRKNLSGSGNLVIDGGNFSGSPLLQTLAAFTRMNELASLGLSDSGGAFQIGNGQVTTERMVFGGTKRRIWLAGTVGLDGALDLETRIGTAPGVDNPLADTLGGALTVESSDGWSEVPVALGGNVAKPLPSVPKRALADKARQELDKQLSGVVPEETRGLLQSLGILKPTAPAAPATNEPATDDAADPEAPAAEPTPAAPEKAVGNLIRGLGGLLGGGGE